MHTQGLSLSVYLMAAILGAFFNIFRSLCMQHDDERNKFKKKLQQQQRSNETTKQVRWKANEKTKKKKKSSQQNMPYRRSLMAILNKDIVENQWDVWALRLRYIICLKNLFVFFTADAFSCCLPAFSAQDAHCLSQCVPENSIASCLFCVPCTSCAFEITSETNGTGIFPRSACVHIRNLIMLCKSPTALYQMTLITLYVEVLTPLTVSLARRIGPFIF